MLNSLEREQKELCEFVHQQLPRQLTRESNFGILLNGEAGTVPGHFLTKDMIQKGQLCQIIAEFYKQKGFSAEIARNEVILSSKDGQRARTVQLIVS
jgi:hypothetical protein